MIKQKISPPPQRPGGADPIADKAMWLIKTHGYDERADRVVQLYEPSAHCTMSLSAFKTSYMHWWEEEKIKEKGKPVRVFATALWLLSSARAAIAGVRMAPDRGFPGYVDADGKIYKNTYRQPQHTGSELGDIQPFLDFLDRFLPDMTERNWFLDWLAYKMLNPQVPGISIWFVADNEDGPREGKFGTGRGFMFRIAHALYGEAYCKSEDFEILAGTSAQAVYTDWQANCLLVTVDEAHSSPTAYRRGEKRSVYTALKNVMDPAPKRRSFKVKGLPAFDGMSYCSIWIATNHANAAAIPASDRRITVLRNGREMTPAEGVEMDAWLRGPGNIAALADYLASSDLSQFNAFAPLKTAGKAEMADLALSDVEHALLDFAADDDRGLVFPKIFLEREVEGQLTGDERSGGSGALWRGQLEGAFNDHCVRVKLPNGQPARMRIGGRQLHLYCFRSRAAAAAALSETGRREHAAKWGHIDTTQTVLKAVPNREPSPSGKGGLTGEMEPPETL